MKKNSVMGALVGSILAGSVYAGSMGPAFTHEIKPFVSAEGFPVWIAFGGMNLVNNGSASSVDNGNFVSGGARLAAGMGYSYLPMVDLTSEAAWNYFGHTSGSVSGKTMGATLSGVDFLVGAAYKYLNTEWFVKGGALFERASINFGLPSTFLLQSGGINVYSQVQASMVVTDVLPEVKVGGIYNYNENIGFSVAYMHAFGQTPHYTGIVTDVGSNKYDYISTNLRAPTLDSVLFGVRYQFV